MDGITFNVVKNPETSQLSVSGRITKVANGYIAEQGGSAFVVRDEEELREALVSTIEQIATNIVKKLSNTQNAEKSLIIDITVNDDTGFMQLASLDDSSKQTIAAVFSALARAGVQTAQGKPIDSSFIRPYNVTSSASGVHNSITDTDSYVTKEQLGTIVEAVETGKKVIIQPKNKNRHY